MPESGGDSRLAVGSNRGRPRSLSNSYPSEYTFLEPIPTKRHWVTAHRNEECKACGLDQHIPRSND